MVRAGLVHGIPCDHDYLRGGGIGHLVDPDPVDLPTAVSGHYEVDDDWGALADSEEKRGAAMGDHGSPATGEDGGVDPRPLVEPRVPQRVDASGHANKTPVPDPPEDSVVLETDFTQLRALDEAVLPGGDVCGRPGDRCAVRLMRLKAPISRSGKKFAPRGARGGAEGADAGKVARGPALGRCSPMEVGSYQGPGAAALCAAGRRAGGGERAGFDPLGDRGADADADRAQLARSRRTW